MIFNWVFFRSNADFLDSFDLEAAGFYIKLLGVVAAAALVGINLNFLLLWEGILTTTSFLDYIILYCFLVCSITRCKLLLL